MTVITTSDSSCDSSCCSPAPYYSGGNANQEYQEAPVIIQEYAHFLVTGADFVVPPSSHVSPIPFDVPVDIYFPGLVSIQIAMFLTNPNYNSFEIIKFNPICNLVTAVNDAFWGYIVEPGTVVPKCTVFLVTT